jgi:acyl CoA:acetate/3-ketoacid CoA transferase
MLTISLKDEVQKVLAREWNSFAQDHPNLAAVIDQTLLVEQAAACLQDDAEYREALELASAAGTSAGVVVDLVERFVLKWLKTLV